MPTVGKVLVEGINMADCHVRATRQDQDERASFVSQISPSRACKVMLVCPKCGKPTRVGYKICWRMVLRVRVCTEQARLRRDSC